MDNKTKSVADQLGLSSKTNEPAKSEGQTGKEKDKDKDKDKDSTGTSTTSEQAEKPKEKINQDKMRRRGFFEAISPTECPMHKMEQLLMEYKNEASMRMQEVDERAGIQIGHLNELIAICRSKIEELTEKLRMAERYREQEDEKLQQLVQQKLLYEQELVALQQRLTDIRIRLGEAKAGIIGKSLAEAEKEVQLALGIQKTIYDQTYQMNQKKFMDEKDYLTRMSNCYQALLKYYEERYRKINTHLTVLDVDGISPVTTQVLTSIGSVSFAAAGFFFSTFASAAGFGNQDLPYFLLQGLFDTAQESNSLIMKITVLLVLLALVTLVSLACNYLIVWLKKKSEEEIQSEVILNSKFSQKTENMDFHAQLKSNNFYGFWLQLIPAIFIVGLIIILVSKNANSASLGSINASSEGLAVGAGLAIVLAGLIYMYIIKIVEPRLVKRYNIHPDQPVNWVKANWELVAILVALLLFCICIIAIPYDKKATFNIIPLDQRTRFAILLFIGVSLAGSISFAYSVRSHGLIQTSRFLEKTLARLNDLIAYCSAPLAPELYNTVPEANGNILLHVLKQLSFKTSLNIQQPVARNRNMKKKKNAMEALMKNLGNLFKGAAKPKSPGPPPIVQLATWEEKYFPHITDELKAIEFEYRDKKAKFQKAEDDISDHKTAKAADKRLYQTEITKHEKDINEHKDKIKAVLEEKSVQYQQLRDEYCLVISELQDGFHLGMYYRENGLGPNPGYYTSCVPNPSAKQPLLLNYNN